MLLSNWLRLINSQVSAKTNMDFPLRPKNTLCYKLNIWSHSSHDNEIEKQKEREGRSKGGRKGGKGKGREREREKKKEKGREERAEGEDEEGRERENHNPATSYNLFYFINPLLFTCTSLFSIRLV